MSTAAAEKNGSRNRRTGRFLAVAAAACASLALTGVSASANQAGAGRTPQDQTAQRDCSLSYVCAFRGDTLVAELAPVKSGDCVTLTEFNNFVNNSEKWQRLWYGKGCTGNSALINPYTSIGNQAFWYSVGGY